MLRSLTKPSWFLGFEILENRRTLHWQRMGREVGALFRARGSGPRVGTPSAGRVATTQQTFHLNQPIPCHCYNSIQYTKYRTEFICQSLMQLARKYGLLLVCPSSSRCIKVPCSETRCVGEKILTDSSCGTVPWSVPRATFAPRCSMRVGPVEGPELCATSKCYTQNSNVAYHASIIW